MSSVVFRCELEVWTYLRCPDEHANNFTVDVMSIRIQRWILLCWRSPQRWCRCWIAVVAKVHVLQHAEVSLKSDCDVSIRMSADALPQEAKWLLRCKTVRTVERFRPKDCRSCSRNNVVSLDVPAMSKSSTHANTMMFFFTQRHLSDFN